MNQPIILNIGGSILSISDDKLFDFAKAREIRDALISLANESYKFLLPVGGGFICRKYQNLLKENNVNDENVDLAGIAAINLNAVMLKAIFGNLANDKILRYEDFDSENSIDIGNHPFQISAAGSKVGRSSDWDSVHLAVKAKAEKVFSLSNIDGVYTADPKKDLNAQRIPKLTWNEYRKIIGNPSGFEAGGHYPIDIVAANLAEEKNISFYLLKGDDMNNLMKAIKGEEFVGSVIN
jgi:uridylate kinase